MEKSYSDYTNNVEHVLKEETLKEIAGKVETFGKFKKSVNGQWVPVHYAGYTLITPTFGSELENNTAYLKLIEIQQELSGCLNLSKIVMAPANALHMTVARLISGEVFEKRILYSRELEFRYFCTQLFSQLTFVKLLKFEIKGISIFPQGVIAAEVSPATEEDYQILQAFRDCIYNDKVLSDLGVERKHGFHGHITLLYLEEELAENDREILAGALIDINRRYFQATLPYDLARAEVRKFNNFLDFYRQDSWPSYQFCN